MPTMTIYERLKQCKKKLDKLALREPRTIEQLAHRVKWERVRKILVRRYDEI
jgi:hypothetical protein